jgi:hypothetical protein
LELVAELPTAISFIFWTGAENIHVLMSKYIHSKLHKQ